VAKPNTLVETVPAFTGSDPLHPVLSDDLARLTTISDDWCFDARNPDCYAGGVLPAIGSAIPVAGLVSLAPGPNTTLNRNLQVTATPSDGAKLPTFDGKGLVFDAGTTSAYLRVQKTGVTQGFVASPSAEGDVPWLEMVAYKAAGLTATNRGPYFAGGWNSTMFGGLFQQGNGQGAPTPYDSGQAVTFSAMWLNTWTSYAALYHNLNRSAQTADVRIWLNGELVYTATGVALPKMFPTNASNGAQIGGGQGTWAGSVARVRRVYLDPVWASLAAQAKLDLAARIVADEYGFLLDSGLFD